MSSSREEVNLTNISQLKSQLQNIIKNIKQLEEIEATPQLEPTQLRLKTKQTDALLRQLEKLSTEKIPKVLQKRRNKRKANKIKQKLKTRKTTLTQQSKKLPAIDAPTPAPASSANVEANAAAATQKPHHQLINYCDAQRFLRTFELLKILHLTRSQEPDETRHFATQFSSLRAIWNSILVENTAQRTQECKIEDQWNEVFFGAPEQTYYSSERKMGDFVCIRRTWDSYLTRSNKHGSSIPAGWVLPQEKADERWLQYSSK